MIPANIPHLLHFLSDWGAPIGAVFGSVTGWLGNVAKNRIQEKRTEIDAGTLENERLKLALCREKDLTNRLLKTNRENQILWSERYQREAILTKYHSAALTAQRLVNELENKLGLHLTIFDDLPGFPPVPDNDEISPPFNIKAGDHAALTADPLSPRKHVLNTPPTPASARPLDKKNNNEVQTK